MTLCDVLCYSYGMERRVTQNDSAKAVSHAARFFPAVDSRKRKIRGLWVRNGKYYAQMRVDRGNGTTKPVRVPLVATSLDDAKSELEQKRSDNRKGEMHLPGHRPKFDALADDYKISASFLAKKKGTQENETQALNRWAAHLGGIRIDWIQTSHLIDFRNQRKASGVSSRTINLDVTAFNNAMAYALDKGLLSTLPRVKKLEEGKPPKRKLLTPAQIGLLLECCVEDVTKNAKLLKFYLRFLLLTGAREQESLKTRKLDADFDIRKLTIGADGDTKNSEYRELDMSAELEALLCEILAELPPDTSFLFPSPQRGTKDIHAQSLRESFYLVRTKAMLPWVGFHDFRHFFISTCAMAGIDFMTIAAWVGHKDGGILIGKVYGHLADDHKKRAAAGLSILS